MTNCVNYGFSGSAVCLLVDQPCNRLAGSFFGRGHGVKIIGINYGLIFFLFEKRKKKKKSNRWVYLLRMFSSCLWRKQVPQPRSRTEKPIKFGFWWAKYLNNWRSKNFEHNKGKKFEISLRFFFSFLVNDDKVIIPS